VTFRYFEDFAEGQVYELGSLDLSKDDIIGFAQLWDPQPFHVDEVAAKDSIYGGLVASGWHTACVFMRLLATNLLIESSSMGSSGLDKLRWIAPVRPGDNLSASFEVLKTRLSDTRPDRGKIFVRAQVKNQDDAVVMFFNASLMLGRRPDASS
jgi:acyl dehydratase